jgi:hypothetical protein
MKVGSPELGTLWATKSRQGKYEERKKGGDGGVYVVAEALADHWGSLGFPLLSKTAG